MNEQTRVTSADRAISSFLPWGATLVVVTGLHVALARALPLPEEAYGRPLLLIEAVSHPPFALLGLLPLSLPLLAWRRLRWGGETMTTAGRPLALAAALVLAWTFTFYEPNHWAGQLHLDARVAVLVLAASVWWHPGFIGPFVACVSLQASQFEFPIGSYSMTDKQPVLSILLVFVACLLVSMTYLRTTARVAPTLSLVVMASWYLAAGLGKLAIGWPVSDDLGNLVASAHANGWLWWWSDGTVLRIAGWVSKLNPLLVAGTLVVELGAAFALTSRALAVRALAMAVGLHVCIFLSSGIAFWKWAVVDVVLLLWVRRQEPWVLVGAPTRRLLLSAATVLVGGVIWRASPLAWYDAPLNVDYEIDAVGLSGRVYRVDSGFFAPYDLVFAQQRFDFLDSAPRLVNTYGSTRDRRLLDRMTGARVPDLESWRSEFGTTGYDEARADRFDDLVRSFFEAEVDDDPEPWIFRLVDPPRHIWAQERSPRYSGQEEVTRVIVRRITTMRQGGEVEELEDLPVRVIPIQGT